MQNHALLPSKVKPIGSKLSFAQIYVTKTMFLHVDAAGSVVEEGVAVDEDSGFSSRFLFSCSEKKTRAPVSE